MPCGVHAPLSFCGFQILRDDPHVSHTMSAHFNVLTTSMCHLECVQVSDYTPCPRNPKNVRRFATLWCPGATENVCKFLFVLCGAHVPILFAGFRLYPRASMCYLKCEQLSDALWRPCVTIVFEKGQQVNKQQGERLRSEKVNKVKKWKWGTGGTGEQVNK